jgi:hypothetical protein
MAFFTRFIDAQTNIFWLHSQKIVQFCINFTEEFFEDKEILNFFRHETRNTEKTRKPRIAHQ